LSMLNLLVYKFVVHALVYIGWSRRDGYGPDPVSESIFLTSSISGVI